MLLIDILGTPKLKYNIKKTQNMYSEFYFFIYRFNYLRREALDFELSFLRNSNKLLSSFVSMEVSLTLYDTTTDTKLDSSLFEFRKNDNSKSKASRRK